MAAQVTGPESYEEFIHPRGLSMRVYGLNDEESPAMRIEVWCEHCGEKLSDSPFDMAAGPPDPEGIAMIGEADALAAVAHLEAAHGV